MTGNVTAGGSGYQRAGDLILAPTRPQASLEMGKLLEALMASCKPLDPERAGSLFSYPICDTKVSAAQADRRGGESPQLSGWEGYPIDPCYWRGEHIGWAICSQGGKGAGPVCHWGKVS